MMSVLSPVMGPVFFILAGLVFLSLFSMPQRISFIIQVSGLALCLYMIGSTIAFSRLKKLQDPKLLKSHEKALFWGTITYAVAACVASLFFAI